MTVYVMQAKENYDAASAVLIENNDYGFALRTTQDYVGVLYDHVRRKIIYSVAFVSGNTETNTTGHPLWSGQTAFAAGEDYDPSSIRNHRIAEKDIDTSAVTFHDCWSASSLVPNGIGGSDGTWRRCVDSSASSGNSPILVDPRTGNVWQHADAFYGEFICTIYLFRRSDSFAQIISPLQPPEGQDGHMDLQCISDDWVYVFLENNLTANYHLLLTPRTIQSDETAADYLLTYAEFDFPTLFNGYYFRVVMDHANNMYLFGGSKVGTRAFKLYKFTEPSSAPFGGPVVGGGFTDITPWAAGTGPNSTAAAYAYDGGNNTGRWNKNLLMFLPATGDLVCVSKLWAGDTGAGVTNPALTQFDCTYVHLAGPTFDLRAAFVTGYMKADWTTTTNPALAAWAVQECREVNVYLGQNSYDFADVDYTKRWLFFTVQPVVAGVWTSNAANNHQILVQYHFVSGAAPAVLQVIDETHWDTAYTDYAATIGNTNVVNASLGSFLGDLTVGDCGVWDETSQAFWFSGATNNMYQLNPAFAYRSADVGISSPFLRLGFGEVPPASPQHTGVTVALIPMRVGVPE